MSWTEPRTWIIGEKLLKADLDAQVRDNLNYLKTNIALNAAVELTIASGEITKSCAHHTVDTEADAASDDLVTINGGSEGEVILIRPSSGSRTVVLKHNTGNIWSPMYMDVSMLDADSYVLLAYSGSKWCIIGAGGGSFTNLNDVPTSYEDQGGKVVGVKEDESGLEFVAAEFPPIHHAVTHKDGGDDEIKLNELGQPILPVDFNLQEADNLCIEELATEPAMTYGRIYRHSVSKKLFFCKEDLEW